MLCPKGHEGQRYTSFLRADVRPARTLAGAGAAAHPAQRDGLGDRLPRPDARDRRLWRAAGRPALSPCLRSRRRPLEPGGGPCPIRPTMSASPRSATESTRSAASTSRTGRRIRNASSGTQAATPGSESGRCPPRAERSRRWRWVARSTRSAGATPIRSTSTRSTIPPPTAGRRWRRCPTGSTISAASRPRAGSTRSAGERTASTSTPACTMSSSPTRAAGGRRRRCRRRAPARARSGMPGASS